MRGLQLAGSVMNVQPCRAGALKRIPISASHVEKRELVSEGHDVVGHPWA
jgi:hypothetical protein